MTHLKLTDFDFELPESLIARYPLPERSASRLLCLDGQTGDVAHRQFMDVLALLQPGDVLVMNNTKVMPARLYGKKETGGKVELLVERVYDSQRALAHIAASKSPKPGTRIHLTDDHALTVLGRENDLFDLEFDEPIHAVMDAIGELPIPPYFKRRAETIDKTRYQTVYADPAGAVAAPTAGLHFTKELLQQIADKGVIIKHVTLHVGAGTFQPVRTEDIESHHMHAEWIDVPADTCDAINQAKESGHRVIAVGTTTVRSLESAARAGMPLKAFSGETDIYIYPGFQFKVVDAMITNFHLPKSSLLIMLSAFAGYENIFSAYHQAVAEQYRFFSYGDAMWVVGHAC